MASKITLGNRPKNFKRTVTFPMLDGTEGSIEVLFKYRTKREFGAFVDDAKAAAGLRLADKTKAEGDDAKEISWQEVHNLGVTANADHLVGIVEGWNLDAEPNRESFEQLANEVPAAATAILEAYSKSIVEGRLGN